MYQNNNQQTQSPWSKKSKTSTCLRSPDRFPQSSLLMTMLPFSLLEGDDSFSITHPFSGFRFCVIYHVSTPKLLSLISVTCPMDTRKAHTVPYNLCHHLWDYLASSVHDLLCNPVGPGQFCAPPSECLALWQCQQLNVSVHHASSVADMASTTVLPLLKAMHHSCLLSWYYTYSIHLHKLAVDFNWCNTHHTQKSKNTSYCKVCHGSGRPSIFNLTYLWYPLIAVQGHNLHVPITCLNLQSHDNISCQTSCYLIF